MKEPEIIQSYQEIDLSLMNESSYTGNFMSLGGNSKSLEKMEFKSKVLFVQKHQNPGTILSSYIIL